MLGPLLMLLDWFTARGGDARSGPISLSCFVIGFAPMMLINATGFVPHRASVFMGDIATMLVTMSIIAAAVRSPLPQIVRQGARAILVIAGATPTSCILSLLVSDSLL